MLRTMLNKSFHIPPNNVSLFSFFLNNESVIYTMLIKTTFPHYQKNHRSNVCSSFHNLMVFHVPKDYHYYHVQFYNQLPYFRQYYEITLRDHQKRSYYSLSTLYPQDQQTYYHLDLLIMFQSFQLYLLIKSYHKHLPYHLDYYILQAYIDNQTIVRGDWGYKIPCAMPLPVRHYLLIVVFPHMTENLLYRLYHNLSLN